MKNFLSKQLALLLMLMSSATINAQYYEWAIATKKDGEAKPVVTDYRCLPETANNGVEYARIHTHEQLEDGLWSFVPQQYGMRIADKKIYVYDFDKGNELVAFDFTLSAGDEFATINGFNWIVKEVSDTLVSEKKSSTEPRKRLHRLLKVETTDGKMTDQWLEDFGSFTNHLMITDMANIEYSQTPWFLYYDASDEESWPECYIAREFSCDPFFGHDTGRVDGAYDDVQKDEPVITIAYENGKVTFTDHCLWWPARYYQLFYRNGDNISCCKNWEFLPHFENGDSFWYTDDIVFTGLTAPASGSYTLHFNGKDISTQIQDIKGKKARVGLFDVQGRRLNSVSERGVYIEDGKVRVVH